MTEPIRSTDPEPFLDRVAEQVNRDPESMADVIEAKTDIEGMDALIVAYAYLGYDDREISTKVGRAASFVEERLSKLRTRRAVLEDELAELQRTADALDSI